MSAHPFYFPEGTPDLTFAALAARLSESCDRSNCMTSVGRIGRTVRYRWHSRAHDAILVQLYDTAIAVLAPDQVTFPNDDPHMATTYWIEKIIQDNGLGWRAGRIRRHAADGPGPWSSRGQAGLLVIDFDRDKPVHGRAWPVTRDRAGAS